MPTETDYKKILKVISKLNQNCIEQCCTYCFDKKKLRFDSFQGIMIPEHLWIAFFLPSKLTELRQNKTRYSKCVGEKIYLIKKDALELIENRQKTEEISEITNPFSQRNDIVIVMLLEIIFAIKQRGLTADFIKENHLLWVKIANHFGLWKIRYILEDSIFEQENPKEYKLLVSLIQSKEKTHHKLFDEIVTIINHYFEKEKIANFQILYRKKNIYGIYKKMQTKGKNINHITDFFGFRILVETVKDCYQVRDILHGLWPFYRERYKDYIEVPKENKYQSIHTTLNCLDNQVVEFQIRTQKMDEIAKFGPASHILYKKLI